MKKKPRVPACITVGVCPFPNLSIPFAVWAGLLGSWDMRHGSGCFVAVVVFKSLSLQNVGQSGQFRRKMRRWAWKEERITDLSRVPFVANQSSSCGRQSCAVSRGRWIPWMRTKSGAVHKGWGRGEGTWWLGRSPLRHPALPDKGGFYRDDAAADTPPCTLQRHRGLGKER